MEIEKQFEIPATPAATYAMLIDLERVGPCIPGGEIGASDGDGSHPAKIAVRLGPMRMSYSGKVRIEEASEAALRAVLEADLREQRGQGTAKARMTMLVSEAGGGSQVATVTAVKLSGRAAQMAQGVIDDVADRLVGEMASCLAARFEPAGEGEERQAPPEAKPINGVRLMLQVLWTKIKRAFGGRRGDADESA